MSKVLLKIKEFGSISRNNFILKLLVCLALVVTTVSGFVFSSYSENMNKGLADNLIRLHVVANSDSTADQALKRDIRDVIIDYMEQHLKESKDIDHTKFIINQNLVAIEEIAKAEMQRQNKVYPVKASLGSYSFPTKVYGDITLPAGKYEALKVVIGAGEGANWWCVLFPPLCFVDATHGTVSEAVKKDLKDSLTAEEYRLITSADSDDEIPIKIKFKIVEFFQDSKIKFTGLISKLFK